MGTTDEAWRDTMPVHTAAELAAARVEGRREANDAINWETSCLGCAGRMNDLARERAEGGQRTAELIVAELRGLHEVLGDPVLLEAIRIASSYTEEGATVAPIHGGEGSN